MRTPAARSLRLQNFNRGRDWLFLALFASALVAFAAVGTRYFDIVFNEITRLGFLALFILFMLQRGYLGCGLTGAFGLLASLYLIWICATILWSQVPILSGLKAVLQVAVTVTFVSAGYVWTRKAPPEHAFEAFVGVMLLVVVTGILGAGVTEAAIHTGGRVLFRGLAYNPNLLGILVLMSMPWTVWFFHSNYRAPWRRRVVAYTALVLVLAVLIFSGARSSILAVGVTGVIYLYYSGLGRYAAILSLAILIGVVAVVTEPDLPDWVWGIISKGTEEGGDVFYSRRQVWEDSLAAAKQGDLFGVGFGVSAGHTQYSGGLSAEEYGREKGNTILAILEELGHVGLILYVLMLASFFGRLISAAARSQNGVLRAQIGLVMGTAFGLIVNSQFEAWFVAPAAPASPFFWSLLGCGLALAQMAEQIARRQRERRLQNVLSLVATTRGVRR